MRYIFFFLIANLLSIHSFAESTNDEVTLECHLQGCGSILSLYEFDGSTFKEFMNVSSQSDSIFTFKLPKSEPKFYYIGIEPSGAVPIILGPEKQVEVDAKCGVRLTLDFTNSPYNTGYLQLKKQMDDLQKEHVKLARQFRQFGKDPERKEILQTQMSALDDQKIDFLDSLKLANPYFAKIAALNTYISFQVYGGEYENEVYYFAEQFFQFVDFKDTTYNQIPWVHKAFEVYTNTLSSIGLDRASHLNLISSQVDRIPSGSRARKLALSAIVTNLKGKNHPNFTPFAEKFVKEFKEQDPGATQDLERIISQTKAFTVGGEAPNFTQPTPEGESVQLTDFRGKVLLVDFWASWCGPCRAENPNVVKVYNKYKDLGFEILGVSLDRSKDRWIKAINDDGLTWPQISDLKGWKNEVAQLYSIRSIPHTILLDREGKIIARNLRGRSLEEKLEEIFDKP